MERWERKEIVDCWWLLVKIWYALRKWQSWEWRHKQTHKSTDSHIDNYGDRKTPYAIAHTLYICYISPSSLLPLSLSNHLATLTLTSLTLLFPLLCLKTICQAIFWFPFSLPRVDWIPLLQSIFLLLFSSLRPRERRTESICPVSPSLWLCLGCSIKVSESMMWVLVSQGELWVLQPGDLRKSRMTLLLGEGWKRKRKEGGIGGRAI